MIITRDSMDALTKGFKTLFLNGIETADTHYRDIASVITSFTAEGVYPSVGQIPGVREWVGDRYIKNLVAQTFTIKNRDFETTIGVDRNAILDDQVGVYGSLMQELGKSAAEYPNELVISLLSGGFANEGPDGQYFFDTDHPVGTNGGDYPIQSVSNMQAGSGTPWFLLDNSRAIKPLIWQERQKPQFQAMDRPDDDNVFFKKVYMYGADARGNAGYGLWQLAFGSKLTLDATNYAAARAAMMSLKGDEGRPLNVKPNLLVVPPSLESVALALLNSEYALGGETNPWKGTAKLIVTSWLARRVLAANAPWAPIRSFRASSLR